MSAKAGIQHKAWRNDERIFRLLRTRYATGHILVVDGGLTLAV